MIVSFLRNRLSAGNPLRMYYRRLRAGAALRSALGRNPCPKDAFFFPCGGLGDDLLCTALADMVATTTGRPVWMLSRHPQLFQNHPSIAAVVHPVEEMAEQMVSLGIRIHRPSYTSNLENGERHLAPTVHILKEMARSTGIKGRLALKPSYHPTAEEQNAASYAAGSIVVQSSGMSARFPIPNKEWFPERFALVASLLAPRFEIIQIGHRDDPPLPGVRDLRGKTTLRELGALLYQARLFVGLAGFPMHLARAVDCPAVIVYGGREAPWQSGYKANLNLVRTPPCAPCWWVGRCDHQRSCMSEIQADHVLAAVETMLAQSRYALPVETADTESTK